MIQSVLEQLAALAERYPQLAAVVLTCIVWPALTGALSFSYSKIEARFPLLVAAMRAAGLDVPRVTAALRVAFDRYLASRKLPPPPPGPLLSLGFVILTCLMLAVLGVGCGAQERIQTALEASRDVAVFAESCAVEAQGLALDRCETEACRAEVKAAFVPIADALDLLHELWCGIAPESEGCDASEAPVLGDGAEGASAAPASDGKGGSQ